MNKSYMSGLGALVLLSLVAAVQADYINHDFEAVPFTTTTNFMTPVLQWQASTAGVVVVNTKSSSGSQSVRVPDQGALWNTVAATNPGVVWTEFHLAPFLGVAPDASATNGVAVVQYFGTNGYLQVWSGTGWLVCSNDVWGRTVAPATDGVFVDIAIYQNFTTRKAAVLLNDQVVLQDLPFLGTSTNYGSFKLSGAEGDVWLDDAYITNTYATARLTNNLNGIDGADAAELQLYGYVARTQYVGVGQTYTALSNALAVARDRDVLYVTGAGYAESVTVTQNLTLVGGFTNNGTITVAAGKTVTVASGFVSSLTVSGTVALAQGVVVSGATVTVVGQVTVPTNNAQFLAGGLSISGGGTVVSTGGRVAGSGVDMTGVFTLDNKLGTQAAMPLDFNDDFELYAPDSQVANLGFRGWGASSAAALVKTNQGVSNSKGVVVPEYSVLSNRIARAGQTKIWTDFYITPALGVAPTSFDTNGTSFLSYVGSNGFLNVWRAGAWSVCSNYLDGSGPVTPMATNAYAHVSVFLNLESHLASVFIEGKLVLQQVPFPAGQTFSNFTSFRAQCPDDGVTLDNIRITTGIPPGLSQAEEIQMYDGLMSGSVFKIR